MWTCLRGTPRRWSWADRTYGTREISHGANLVLSTPGPSVSTGTECCPNQARTQVMPVTRLDIPAADSPVVSVSWSHSATEERPVLGNHQNLLFGLVGTCFPWGCREQAACGEGALARGPGAEWGGEEQEGRWSCAVWGCPWGRASTDELRALGGSSASRSSPWLHPGTRVLEEPSLPAWPAGSWCPRPTQHGPSLRGAAIPRHSLQSPIQDDLAPLEMGPLSPPKAGTHLELSEGSHKAPRLM